MEKNELLKPLCKAWLGMVDRAIKAKRDFDLDADEAMQFFDGDHNWMWRSDYTLGDRGFLGSTIAPPTFRMTVNKVFEAVKIFGSVLYARNPIRTCTVQDIPEVPNLQVMQLMQSARQMQQQAQMMPQDPMQALSMGQDPNQPNAQMMLSFAQQQAMQAQNIQAILEQQKEDERQMREGACNVMSSYLNYTPNEMDAKGHSRKAIDEAIITGMGVMWTELYESPVTQTKLTGSFYDTVWNYVKDPDAKENADVKWIARRCVHPVWQVEDEYGYERGYLKEYANLESAESQGAGKADVNNSYKRAQGKTNDQMVYWKVYSKMGLGGRLRDNKKDGEAQWDLGWIGDRLEDFGDFCYVVVAEGVPHPLNIPPSLMQGEMKVNEETGEEQLPDELFLAAQWPIPFWADNDWPVTEIVFNEKPGSIWPISHIKPGIGELRFINWAMSFLATKISTSCETVVGVAKWASDDVKGQLLRHSESGFKVVELAEATGKTLDEIVHVFQMPQVNGDIWQIISAVMEMLDKRLALTELAYGQSSRQYRSAQEAMIKRDAMNVRPDDMANIVEDACTDMARKEALAARWLLSGQDVGPIVGQDGAQFWDQVIATQDLGTSVREYEYRIESGSARKINKDTQIAQANEAMTSLMPVFQWYATQTGDLAPINTVLQLWSKANDVKMPILQPPPPPPPMPQSGPQEEAQEGAGDNPQEESQEQQPPQGPPNA